MKTISTITKEQEAQIPKYIQKWVDLASAPIDKEKAKAVFKKIYGEDKLIVFGQSFENMIALIRLATEGKNLEYDSQLYSQLYSQLRSQLDSQLYSQLRSQLDSQLYSQLYSQNIKYSSYVSYYLYDWAGYYDYVQNIGVEFDKNSLQEYFDILLNIPIVVFIGNVLFVCEKPKCSWSNSFLHSERLPAIRWEDGTGIYFLNGVRFEKEMWEKVVNKQMSFEDVMKIVDVDQRTQAMKYVSFEKFVKHAGATVVDTFQKFKFDGSPINYTLYKFPAGEIFQSDENIVHFTCPSTANEYTHGVEQSWGNTVPEVMAAMFSNPDLGLICTPDEWRSLVPMTDEA